MQVKCGLGQGQMGGVLSRDSVLVVPAAPQVPPQLDVGHVALVRGLRTGLRPLEVGSPGSRIGL